MIHRRKCQFTLLLLGFFMTGNLVAQKLDYKVLKVGQHCNHKIAENYIVRSKSELTEFDIEQPDSIDFDRNLLIAVYRGGCPSGGYSIGIHEILKTNKGLTIFVIFSDPGENCSRSLALTQPYAIYSIEKTDLPISFDTSTIVKDCGQPVN
jgi:hypothetical protein